MNINQAFKAIKPAIGRILLTDSVKIEAAANRMMLTANNLTFSLSAAAEYSGTPFTCCANGKLLGEALDKLLHPDIAFAGNKLVLTEGRTRISLATSSPDDFPADKECAETMLVEARVAPHMQRVFYAAANKDIRYYLMGVALQGSPAGIAAVATDGHRMAISRTDADVDTFEIIIPRESAQALIVLDPETLTIGLENGTPKHLLAERGDTHLTTMLLEGKFPDWRRILPSHSDAISTNRADLIAKLGILKPFVGTSGVKIDTDAELLRMATSSVEAASAECALPCTGSDNLDIAFNITNLIEALQGITTEDVIIMHGDSTQAIRLDDGDHTAIVMPMRV